MSTTKNSSKPLDGFASGFSKIFSFSLQGLKLLKSSIIINPDSFTRF